MSYDLNACELVVLVDDDGTPTGSMTKSSVHSRTTPLHLAFSCHITDTAGRVLVTRRAIAKATWPGVWTNACCGHPSPGESAEEAVRRRAKFELGIELDALALALPVFRYRAVDAAGIVENELCPVYTAVAVGSLNPRPDEVAEYAWVNPHDLALAVKATPFTFSPWLVLQLRELAGAGVGPLASAESVPVVTDAGRR